MKALLAKTLAAAAVALALGFAAAPAEAGHYQPHYAYKKVVTYKTILTYEVRQVPHTQYVTAYDHCGRPYQVAKTFYKEIQVPVERQVPVVHYVKVGY